ncbi:MAG: hypothetical protein J5855_10230 [Mailhella sp.]|nr:hypothetical protein [Mailhella sp.]
MSVGKARLAALKVLEKRKADVPVPALLEDAFVKYGLDERDRAFCTGLAYGTMRCFGFLRHLFERHAKNPDKLPDACVLCLCMALYEICFRHTPDHAVVSEYVKIANKRAGAVLSRVVSGILHAFLRGYDPAAGVDFFSLPDDEVQMACGLDAFFRNSASEGKTEAARSFLFMPSPSYRLKDKAADAVLPHNAVRCGRTVLCGDVRDGTGRLDSSGEFNRAMSRLVAGGEATRQGASAQLLCRRITRYVPKDAAIWDACCGRGGKTLALAESGMNVVFASDPSERRLAEFAQECRRLKITVPPTEALPLEAISPGRKAWCVLIDVPCSGSGTLGRNPELKFRITPQRLAAVESVQKSLLQEAWRRTPQGGLMIYATCSIFRRENEGRIGEFLAGEPGARLLAMENIGAGSWKDEKDGFSEDLLLGQDRLFYAVMQRLS